MEASLSDASAMVKRRRPMGHQRVSHVRKMPVVSQVEVAISFAVTVGGEPFECGGYPNLGVTAADMGFNDMRFVHDVFLIDVEGATTPVVIEDDGVWQRDGVSLLDFEDGCENGAQQVNQVVKAPSRAATTQGYASLWGPAGLNSSETVLEGAEPLTRLRCFGPGSRATSITWMETRALSACISAHRGALTTSRAPR